MPSVSVAVTWSEPEGKFKIPENVPARLGTWVPVNVPESEQLELVPEYVPEIVVPLRVPCPVKTFPPSLKVRVMLLPLTVPVMLFWPGEELEQAPLTYQTPFK